MADLVIIDDDLDTVDALAMAVQALGHQVRIGYDGQEGMRLVKERSPDLVLVDVEMPVMTGPGMALAMFLHNTGLEDIPVILLSGVPDLERIAGEVGTRYFLAKPYRLATLATLIDRALTERAAPRRPATQ